MRIGLISDTHGLLRPEAVEALHGSELILHAGDVGAAAVLDSLAEICPVRAVRGNMDGGAWGRTLPGSEAVELAGRLIYMLHDLGQLDLDPEAAGISAVIFGHSHVPAVQRRDGVLYVNPGSAGPQRPGKPISVGLLELGDELEAKIIEII